MTMTSAWPTILNELVATKSAASATTATMTSPTMTRGSDGGRACSVRRVRARGQVEVGGWRWEVGERTRGRHRVSEPAPLKFAPTSYREPPTCLRLLRRRALHRRGDRLRRRLLALGEG